MSFRRFIMVAGLVVMTAGCAAAPPPTATTASDKEPYRLESEGQVAAPKAMPREVDRVDVFEETPVAEGAFAVESVETVEEPIVQDLGEDTLATTGMGFRVQVFASGDPEAAEALEKQVETRMKIAAYTEFVDGMYKVRVGDCQDRAEADKLRLRCWAAGFKDAWIVATEVKRKRPAPEGEPAPDGP